MIWFWVTPPGSPRRLFSTVIGRAVVKISDLDSSHGIIVGTHNPYFGPAIRFEPSDVPYFVSGVE